MITNAKETYTVAEFFCGCGGFSRGFSRTGRFRTVLGNDIKLEALQTFAVNHCASGDAPTLVREDIRTVTLNAVARALSDHGAGPGELDCLIGGPPCQGFSQLRRAEEREKGKIVKFRGYSKLAHDPRNDLVLRFLELAEHLRPKVIVIENVPQMLNHGQNGRLGQLSETVVDILERDLGYSVAVAILTAADYGVPQLRDRAIFLASSITRASLPKPTHADPAHIDLIATGKKPWTTVRDAIGDLPPPSMDSDDNGGKDTGLYRATSSELATRLRSLHSFPWNHITRTYSESVLDIIREMEPGEEWDAAMRRMQARYARQIHAYAKVKRVSQAKAEHALTLAGRINPVFYKRYYWSAYTRLDWDSPSLTITANANFLGSGRFTHPEEMRGITMREAARLQSFDDEFRFVTSSNDDSNTTRIGIGLDMIGEAVPPIMAEAIASEIATQLDQRQSAVA